MPRFLLARPLLIIACTLTAWAATPPKSPQEPARAGLLYVGLFNGQTVNIYQIGKDRPPTHLYDGLSNITGDIAVDQAQRVYATASSVVVYPPGGLVPARRYQFPDQTQPPIVQGTIVGSDGKLYAALYNDGVVVAYDKGNVNKASLTIPMPFGNTAFAVALDSQNNLYIEYGAPAPFPQPGHIEKCAPGSTQCTDLGITLGAPGLHMAVDSQSNIIVCDQLAGHIVVFPPGGTQPRVISEGLIGCPFFTLNKSEDLLYVANQPHEGNNRGISVFDYASGTVKSTITTGIPADDLIFGVAISPVPQPAR